MDGTWRVVELGDGQGSDRPATTPVEDLISTTLSTRNSRAIGSVPGSAIDRRITTAGSRRAGDRERHSRAPTSRLRFTAATCAKTMEARAGPGVLPEMAVGAGCRWVHSTGVNSVERSSTDVTCQRLTCSNDVSAGQRCCPGKPSSRTCRAMAASWTVGRFRADMPRR
ncbi:hypothetical protein [Paractinoplanes globisporus]|uniref:Uncharacterized protein n=1 Tax=Paractinoplanes globisporus TaxID=113565 RepID=A0ABW6WI84_9ACTN